MPKIFTVLLAVILAVLLVACDESANNMSSSSQVSESASSVESSSSSEISQSDALPLTVGVSGVGEDNYPRIDGSTANMPLMAALYSKICDVPLEEAETFVWTSGGTGAVWRNMIYGGADLLLVYEAPENIREELEESGLWDELEVTPLGRDGLVFLVNKDNPVESLTHEQLSGIYSGVITDWDDVGGEVGPITAFQRNLESGSQTLFLNLLMGDAVPMEAPSELRPAAMGSLIDAVATYDGSGGAIGFSVYYYANLMIESPNLKLLRVDDVEPTAQSISSGDYPLVNDFYVVIQKSEPEGSPARSLRDWLLSEEGRELMRAENYVPIG